MYGIYKYFKNVYVTNIQLLKAESLSIVLLRFYILLKGS